MYRVGIDIGGTFTDMLLVAEDGTVVIGKTLTTPADPSQAVENALQPALKNGAGAVGERGTLIHGTTLVTNALIERKGALTALLTTAGFRDAVEIGREHRYELYDLNLELPRPLVPRHLRFDVPERVAADGRVLQPLDEEFVRRLVTELRDKGIRAIGVSYLHSFRNPAHERRTAELVAELAPQIRVSLSSEVVAEIREFQRTSTTLANVYVQERVANYLAQLQHRLDAIGFAGSFFVMLSSGGIATRETSSRFPVRLLESGPAAGALAAAHAGLLSGHRDLLSFDMGGTTAKLCVIEDGEPLKTHEFEVDRVYRFRKGSGLPIRIPVIDMIEIGAGGGSIARVDSLGLLKVGPESAGAEPGPVCYRQGGREPTVTDADLVLGYLDPNYFLGGKMVLDAEAARDALAVAVYDLVLLDLMLPDGRGIPFLRALRARGEVTPVIILTALDQVSDRIEGLNAGADDYLVKPFDLAELSARIGSVARRYAGNPNPMIRLGALEVDLAARSVRKEGRLIPLTAREWVLFETFLQRPGQLLSKAQLEERLYSFDTEIESNTIEVHVSRLRKKLGHSVIETERGLGYRLGTA